MTDVARDAGELEEYSWVEVQVQAHVYVHDQGSEVMQLVASAALDALALEKAASRRGIRVRYSEGPGRVSVYVQIPAGYAATVLRALAESQNTGYALAVVEDAHSEAEVVQRWFEGQSWEVYAHEEIS